MGAENAGETFFAIKGNPCELATVIIQKTRSKAHTSSCSDIGQRSIMVGTVEVVNLSGIDQAMLDGL